MNKTKYGHAIALVGMQYGSEGKGAIAEYLAPITSTAVRIGAANAGHTVFYKDVPYVMRQIPCGWIYPHVHLVIGISSLISLSVLVEEIELIEKNLPIKHRLHIDANALVITDDQIQRELQTTLATGIASTSAKSGLGIGMALADKILRKKSCRFAKDVPQLKPYINDTVLFLNNQLDDEQIVVFEGTQGFGLSLEHGFFPFTTSRDTTAQSLFAGAGVNPYDHVTEVVGVVRAYPIRVGGNSGPFDLDSEEITWEEVKRRSGATRDVTEKTSVTKTTRRVATFSWEGIRRACMVNRPKELALTFADHLDATVFGKEELSEIIDRFIYRLETETGVRVDLVKTGPRMTIDFDPYRRNILRKIS